MPGSAVSWQPQALPALGLLSREQEEKEPGLWDAHRESQEGFMEPRTWVW